MNRAPLLQADATTLLIVDMQTRLAAAMPAEARAGARDSAIALARAASELDLPVVVTRQYPKGLGDTMPEIAAALPAHAVTCEKTAFAASDSDEVRTALAMSGRTQVVICGMEAHVCVLQTAFGLLALDHAPFVVTDAVCSREPTHRDNALARMAAGGIPTINRESCLFEWLRDARHPHFKAVSALLP